MIRLKLFGLHLRIHYFFWILCAVACFGQLGKMKIDDLIVIPILIGTILVSMLWHELGHVIYRKKYGAPMSEITLSGMGGMTTGPGSFSRKQRLFIFLAGPVFSLILGGAIYGLLFTPWAENVLFDRFIELGVMFNIGWAIFNLLPVLPLDGGRIVEVLSSKKHEKILPWVSVLLSIMIIVVGTITARYPAAFIFVFVLLANIKMIRSGTYHDSEQA